MAATVLLPAVVALAARNACPSLMRSRARALCATSQLQATAWQLPQPVWRPRNQEGSRSRLAIVVVLIVSSSNPASGQAGGRALSSSPQFINTRPELFCLRRR